MIRTDKEYNDAKARYEEQEKAFVEHKKRLAAMKLTPDQVKTLHCQMGEEIAWYERVKKGDFNPSTDLAHIGRTLIAIRIARSWTQRDLAEKLGITESQMSRDERNEYHGISVERVQKILSALGANLKLNLDLPRTRAA